jgi:translation initiation factor IF-2
MSDTKDSDNTGRRPLTLKRADSGTVKQSFSHGRSKSVVVETKKKRVVVTPGANPKVVRPEPEKTIEKPSAALTPAQEAIQKSGLSEAELKARQAAIAQRRADDERRRAEQEAIDEANRRREEAALRLAEEEKRRSETGAQRAADDEEVDTRPAAFGRGARDEGGERDFRRDGRGGAPPRAGAGAAGPRACSSRC